MKIIFSKNYVNCYSIVDFAIIDDYSIFIIILNQNNFLFIFLLKKISSVISIINTYIYVYIEF